MFEDSRLGLDTWAYIFWAASTPTGVSATDVVDECMVTYKSARLALRYLEAVFIMPETPTAARIKATCRGVEFAFSTVEDAVEFLRAIGVGAESQRPL